METTLFKIVDVCHSHQIETTFIKELHDNGLIQITVVESQEYIDEDQLPLIERYTNLYYDLELNMQGLEIVENLLQRIQALQDEIIRLKCNE